MGGCRGVSEGWMLGGWSAGVGRWSGWENVCVWREPIEDRGVE